MHGDQIIAILVPLSFFAMVFGIIYIRSRENMAMIEKGQNPRVKDTRPRPFINLKWGLLLVGSGLGLLLAYIIDHTLIQKHETHTTTASITVGGHHGYGRHHHSYHIETGDHTNNTDTTAVKDTTKASDATAAKHAADNDEEDDDTETVYRSNDPENPAIYFALIAIGGGLGLVLSYAVEKKHWLDKMNNNKES